MKSKLNFLIGVSLKRKIKTKWFVIANLILAIAIIGVINIDSIITLFGGDFNQDQNIYVIDETNNNVYEILEEQLKQTEQAFNLGNNTETEESKYKIQKYEKTVDEAKKIIEEEDQNAIVVVLEQDKTKELIVTMISEQYLDTMDSQIITTSINNTKSALAIKESNIPIEQINKIYEPAKIERVYLDESKNQEEEGMEMIMTTVFPIIILPFFMLTLFLVQMIGGEVNDEKTTRGMEIIISNVSPTTHFASKVIAGNLFVLMQGALLILFGAIGLGVRKLIGGSDIVNGIGSEVGGIINQMIQTDLGSKMIYMIPLALLLMILTFIAYSLLAGILASMTTNMEDFQQLQTPIMIISLVGYYLAMMAGVFEGSLFIKIFAFVPFISAILAPSLLVLGQIGIIEILIAIILVIITNYLLVKYGLKIYKVGILNYSSKGLWKKMFKALKD